MINIVIGRYNGQICVSYVGKVYDIMGESTIDEMKIFVASEGVSSLERATVVGVSLMLINTNCLMLP